MNTNATTSTPKPERARAPGKIILSGEHAVVYGAPALAVAIDHYTEVWFTPMHRSDGLLTAFENMSQGQIYPLKMLKGFKKNLDKRFNQFTRGELPVQEILQRPDDLAIYTMASLLHNLPATAENSVHHLPAPGISATRHLPIPGQLSSRSDLPLGAGMGSSAAIIAATIVLYEQLLNHSQTLDTRYERVRFCERLQHGKGSAIDAAAVVHGGISRIEDDVLSHPDLVKAHPLWSGQGWYWVLHGTPASSTGECVETVRKIHGKDQSLWQDFAACTNALQSALEGNGDPEAALRENHRLLCHIGVVPASAQRFIKAVELAGGVAKTCGAGAVRGDYGGVILVHMSDADAMEALMSHYPEHRWEPLKIAPNGAHLSEKTNGAAHGAAP